MKILWYLVLSIVFALCTKTPGKVNLVNQASLPDKRQISWGAYPGEKISDKQELEEKVGRKMQMVATFVNWDNHANFPAKLASELKANDQTLVIYWESRDEKIRNVNDPKYSYDAILRGDFDQYIREFGEEVRQAKVPTIVLPFIEMNGNWYPWSITTNGNSQVKHIMAYRKLYTMLHEIPNLKLGWVVNNGSVPSTVHNSIAMLYPGDQYTDYVGIDGFNFGNPDQSFREVFDESLKELRELGKPIYIFSMATADGQGKALWIQDMNKQLLKYPEIQGFIWFNINKERDWRIWSDPESLEAFKLMLTIMEN